MHQPFRHLRYMVRWLEPVSARHPRATQRALADHLRQRLEADGDWRLHSRSHSRGTVAVAGGNPPLTRLGVDVEYADPRRPWRDIASLWLPAFADTRGLGPPEFCRGWTFGEAHLKAFGAVPAPETLIAALRAPHSDDEPVRFGARRYWYSEPLPGDFWLTLVWEEEI